jgi:predicted transposase/invertase (TIGR01784 family)
MNFLAAHSEEELSMLSSQTQNPQIQRAVAKIVALNTDERVRMEAESREKLRRDVHDMESAAEDRGLQRGLQKGLEQGLQKGRWEERRAIAGKLFGRGLSVEDIVEMTDWPRDVVESMLRGVNEQ